MGLSKEVQLSRSGSFEADLVRKLIGIWLSSDLWNEMLASSLLRNFEATHVVTVQQRLRLVH